MMIIANLKMYLNTIDDIKKFQVDMADYKDSFIVAPQSIYLQNFIDNGFKVAAQNVSDEEFGPYTGEISPKSLFDLNVEYVMIGHSEVRERYFNESNYILQKVLKAIKNNLNVILCIGEKKGEDVYKIIDERLHDIVPNKNLIISYEPIWTIGCNSIPDLESLQDIVNYIKSKGFNTVLYGGSVNETNIRELIKVKSIDGFLVGSSAINPSEFKKIIEVVR